MVVRGTDRGLALADRGSAPGARDGVGAAPAQSLAAPARRNAPLLIPKADPTFWVEQSVARFLHVVGERSAKGDRVNILLTGPTGTGKSSLPRECAAAWQRPFFAMHCQLVTEQGDWWGTREVSPSEGTYFLPAAFVDAVETPGSVILLDEANRTTPENLSALFGLLDHRRSAWVPSLHREIAVAPGVVFMVTLNEGADYVGAYAVDRALRDRLSNTIRLKHPPCDVELGIVMKRTGIEGPSAKRLVEFANIIRSNPKLGVTVSTRQIMECATLVQEGLAFSDAVLFCIVNAAREEVDRKALLQAIQLTGEVQEAYLERPAPNDD